MMIRRITYTLLYVLSLAGIIFLAGFAADRSLKAPCSGPFISLESRSGNYFINTESVSSLIAKHFDTLDGKPVSPEKLSSMHNVINNIPFVEKADVFRAGTGKIGVEITLRDPLIRVITRDNESYYIDQEGWLFPLSTNHTARVMLATGHITSGYAPGLRAICEDDEERSEGLCDLHSLYELASFIHSDPFWKAFIDHIIMLPGGKFELIPKNGVHTVEFGKARDMAEKFEKLRLFYMNSLPAKGWHHYNRINLEYHNQVICSK